ncbi:MAG: aminotransferase class I/II-fold pyridoxal phosphate-dependent enzyme [Rickettsiales bacterium]|nr:aminotransferase class I/II-fold pyridoxal phosphate-dependent enzyme [Rickettsiales bacterium]
MSNYQNKNINFKNLKIETQLVRGGSIRSNFGETSEAIFMNSGFCYNNAETAERRFNKEEPGFVYSRYLNPNLKMLEDRLSLIENAESACVMASGMSAVFSSIMCQLKAGDHFVASKVLFGSCFHIATKILPNYGIEVSLVAGSNQDDWQKAFRPNTKLVFIETPANPTLEIIDIAMIAKICKKNNAKLIVDNIFASPYCQKPLELGADIVVYSTTKHLDGQGRSLGGCVLGKADFINEILLPFHRHTGPALSPFNSWIILKSLETFHLRMERHCNNALAIAKFLDQHPKIEKVFYPALSSHPQHKIAQSQMISGGAMIAFEIKGEKQQTFNFLNKLNLIDISNNLGDSKSLITHPATTTHSNLSTKEQLEINIKPTSCRLSVGIENHEDLIEDLKQGLQSI